MGGPEWLKPIITTLILIAVGALTGIFFVKVLKKPVLGHIWGGIIVGVIGGILGGFFLNKVIIWLQFLVVNQLDVNFVAAFLGAFLVVWLFSKVSNQK